MRELNIEKKYLEMIGTNQVLSGCLFRGSNIVYPDTEFKVIDIRFSQCIIMDMQKMKPLHPSYELLLKNETMDKAKWTRPLPIKEIKL